jgi:hypothetical protein
MTGKYVKGRRKKNLGINNKLEDLARVWVPWGWENHQLAADETMVWLIDREIPRSDA